jgi:hypothetical protein
MTSSNRDPFSRMTAQTSAEYKAAQHFAKLGWRVGFFTRGAKKPPPGDLRGFKHFLTDAEALLEWRMEFKGACNLAGTPPEGTMVLDFDLYKLIDPEALGHAPTDFDKAAHTSAEAKVLKMAADIKASVQRSARGGLHMLVQESPELNNAALRALAGCPGEVKRHMMGYVMLAPSTYDKRPYRAVKGHEFDGRPAPALPTRLMKPIEVKPAPSVYEGEEDMLDTGDGFLEDKPKAQPPSASEVKAMLRVLDPDCSHDEWIKVGLALHATLGPDRGFKAWDWWSKQSILDNYETEGPYSTAAKWKTFNPEGKPVDKLVQAGTLVRMARLAGWQRTTPQQDFGDGWYLKALVAPLLNAPAPKPDWVLQDTVERGDVILLGGAGGTGKSMLLYRTGSMLAIGRGGVLGLGTTALSTARPGTPGRAMLITMEDDTRRIARRMHAVADSLELNKAERATLGERFSVMYAGGLSVGLVNRDKMKPSVFAELMLEELQKVQGLDLLMLDPAVFFTTGSIVDTEDVMLTVNVLLRLAREAHIAVILASHVSKGAASSKTSAEAVQASDIKGNMGFTDLTRGAFMVHTMTETDAKEYGIVDTIRTKYVWVQQVKTNDVRVEPVWMERTDRGALIPPMVPLAKILPEQRKAIVVAQKVERKKELADINDAVAQHRNSEFIAALLKDVKDHPCDGVRARANRLGGDKTRVTRTMTTLIEESYIKETKPPGNKKESATYAVTAGGKLMMEGL